jgi:hypothetical protein
MSTSGSNIFGQFEKTTWVLSPSSFKFPLLRDPIAWFFIRLLMAIFAKGSIGNKIKKAIFLMGI